MGISASIAGKKYRLQDTASQTQDEDDGLSSVDSFRPNSPWAHPQARVGMANGHIPAVPPRALGYYGYNTNDSRGGSLSSGPPFRSMFEIRDFLLHNPELICDKKKKKVKATDLMLPTEQKQIKTKQGVYLGLISPPVVYGTGVDPYTNGGRIKVNQKLYLGLVYPTVSRPLYHEPVVRAPRQIRHPQDMMVVRKDGYNIQKTPKNVRQRQPLPPPESKKSESRKSEPKTNSLPRMGRGMVVERVQIPSDRRAATLQRSSRASNDYVNTPDFARKQDFYPVMRVQTSKLPYMESHGSSSKTSTLDSRYSRNGAKSADSKVEFTFNVDELNLRQRNRTNHFVQRHERNPVAPLYFRKSLAYSPKYDNGPEMLSAPL